MCSQGRPQEKRTQDVHNPRTFPERAIPILNRSVGRTCFVESLASWRTRSRRLHVQTAQCLFRRLHVEYNAVSLAYSFDVFQNSVYVFLEIATSAHNHLLQVHPRRSRPSHVLRQCLLILTKRLDPRRPQHDLQHLQRPRHPLQRLARQHGRRAYKPLERAVPVHNGLH